MTSYLSIVLFVASISMAVNDARVIPAEPVSMMLDAYGNPVLFLREKRAPVRPFIPHRAMMVTGYYRPARRSDDGNQATGVFAQGNAVSGGSYLTGIRPTYLKGGPEPLEEPEVSSANAEAGPEPPSETDYTKNVAPEDILHQQHAESPDQQGIFGAEDQAQEPVAEPELPTQHEGASPQSQNPYNDPTELAAEVPAQPETATPIAARPPNKKGKKTPTVFPVEDDDDDEDDDEDEEPYPSFVPTKPNRRQGYVPNLTNLFPMMFSFPGLGRRGSGGGTPPGLITAIANSYSTSKGGVASSIATAYGGSPNGKKTRRAPGTQE